jgi:transposase-like protein
VSRPGYPKDMREFRGKFSSNAACLEYLVKCRWPDGFVCPKCSSKNACLLATRPVFKCRECLHQTYVMAGTIMHRSHLPLQEWFWAAYLMATHTPGISALQLQRQLGIGSYKNAWHLLHRLRKGMVNDGRTKLSGLVEVDEAIIGGPAKGKRGRGSTSAEHKSLVIGAVEVLVYEDKEGKRKERAGRLRLSMIDDASEDSLGPFLTNNIEAKSRVRTDGWPGYSETALSKYIHHVRIVGSPLRAHKRFPHIHKVFGNLKTWLNGTHHGVEPKHLPSYLDEFVFRFNRRKTPMAAFQTLLGISVHKSPMTLSELMSGVSKE